jgi:hypothetical protein
LRRFARLALLISLAAAPTGAQACRITPNQAQVDSYLMDRFMRAVAAVDVEALSGEGDEPGHIRLRVLHSYKGEYLPGAIVEVRGSASFICSCVCVAPGSIGRGQRVLLLLTPEDDGLSYDGPLYEVEVAIFQRLGVLPGSASAYALHPAGGMTVLPPAIP